MTTAIETINTIKSVSNDIEAAITAGNINEAISLENLRHEKINSLASMDLEEITLKSGRSSPLSLAVFRRIST